MSNKREDKPPKRKQSPNINKALQSSSKHLRNNAKQSIPLKETSQVIEDFYTSIRTLPSGRYDGILGPMWHTTSPIAYDTDIHLNPQYIAMDFSDHFQRERYGTN